MICRQLKTDETYLAVRQAIFYKMRALAILLILGEGSALAQQRTMAIYGDWTVSCAIASGSGGGKSCGLVQVQKLKEQTVSQIGIGRNTKNDPLKISIEISANAWVPTGVKLITSGGAPAITAAIKWCVSTRCLADADLSDADIKSLRTQREMGLIAYKNASQADVSIPVSFGGFNEAMDALQKD
jgi:invasion protein IalB